jgi:hypothetical protein
VAGTESFTGEVTRVRHFPDMDFMVSAPMPEFLPSRPEVAELVGGRPSWRECEHIKRFGKHLLEVILVCGADGDVRIELLACCFWDKRRDVVDGRLIDLGVFLRGDVGCSGTRFLRNFGKSAVNGAVSGSGRCATQAALL